MSRKKIFFTFFITLLFSLNGLSIQTGQKESAAAPRSLDLGDVLAWKTIRNSVISPDGKWFVYRLAPNKGDSLVIIRGTKDDKEYTFQGGEAPLYSRSRDIAVSKDSRWAAFLVYPTEKEARTLKKQKKTPTNRAVVVELSSGEKVSFEKIQRFSFSGENAGWIALHRTVPENRKQEKEKWEGSDLILYDLKKKNELNIGNVSAFVFNKPGNMLAMAIDAREKMGNGIQLLHMTEGKIVTLDSGRSSYKQPAWSEEGDALAVLKGTEDENYEDTLFQVVGFRKFSGADFEKIVFDPSEKKDFPDNMTVSDNRTPEWTEDLSGILFGIHEVKKKENKKSADKDKEENEKKPAPASKEKKIDKEDIPGLVVWHWKDKRLQSMQQVQQGRDKNFSYLCVFYPDEKKFIRLADDSLRDVRPAPKHLYALGYDDGPYELSGNLDGRRFRDIYVLNLKTGDRRPALKKCRWYFGPSPEGTHFLYYGEGHFFVYDMTSGKSRNITEDVPVSFIDTEDDHNVVDPPIRPVGWTKGGESVLLYDNWDIWKIDIDSGEASNLTRDGREKKIRYNRRFILDPEEKGINLEPPVYLNAYEEWTKKSGIARLDPKGKGIKMLLWDDALFSLRKAEDADVYFYTRQTFKDYPDYYIAGPSLVNGKRITEANPQQKNFLWSDGSMLVDYESEKGDKLQAALFLPAEYEEGKSYPTVVYIYEKLSQRLNAYFTPRAYGFDKSFYTSNGYAVLMPDIVYTVNDPGMSSVWCVLPAVEAAAATGIVDKARVAIHGHSWGGYQTSFLITQTDLFQAAVAGAPLTNMISMYSSIYWNTGSANQPIFESSQGRFEGGYWDNIEAYTRNSPVYFAENVTTPLLLLHNDKDGAVDWNQGIEYFNTLRRLKQPVVMLQYKGENHGLRIPPNQRDYFVRMKEFLDHHLKGQEAPSWLTNGVSYLDLEEHLEKRAKKLLPPEKEKSEKKKKQEK